MASSEANKTQGTVASLSDVEKAVRELEGRARRTPDAVRMNERGIAELRRRLPLAERPLSDIFALRIIPDDRLPDGAILARIGGQWEVFTLPAAKPGRGPINASFCPHCRLHEGGPHAFNCPNPDHIWETVPPGWVNGESGEYMFTEKCSGCERKRVKWGNFRTGQGPTFTDGSCPDWWGRIGTGTDG